VVGENLKRRESKLTHYRALIMLAILPVLCCNISMKIFYALLTLLILGGCSGSESYTESVPIAAPVTQEVVAEKSIMLIGDSITYRMPPFPEIEGISIDNQGVGGNRVIDEKDLITDRLAYCPDMIIIMLLINDLGCIYRGKGCSIESSRDAYIQILDTIEDICPATEVCIQSILPVSDSDGKTSERTRQALIDIIILNEWLEAVCQERGLVFINHHDLFLDDNGYLAEEYTIDGVHLTELGYSVLHDALLPYIIAPTGK